jgi:hypothetical protein
MTSRVHEPVHASTSSCFSCFSAIFRWLNVRRDDIRPPTSSNSSASLRRLTSVQAIQRPPSLRRFARLPMLSRYSSSAKLPMLHRYSSSNAQLTPRFKFRLMSTRMNSLHNLRVSQPLSQTTGTRLPTHMVLGSYPPSAGIGSFIPLQQSPLIKSLHNLRVSKPLSPTTGTRLPRRMVLGSYPPSCGIGSFIPCNKVPHTIIATPQHARVTRREVNEVNLQHTQHRSSVARRFGSDGDARPVPRLLPQRTVAQEPACYNARQSQTDALDGRLISPALLTFPPDRYVYVSQDCTVHCSFK